MVSRKITITGGHSCTKMPQFVKDQGIGFQEELLAAASLPQPDIKETGPGAIQNLSTERAGYNHRILRSHERIIVEFMRSWYLEDIGCGDTSSGLKYIGNQR